MNDDLLPVNNTDKAEKSICDLIKDIEQGVYNPKDITIEQRRQIVNECLIDGLSKGQIAKLLQIRHQRVSDCITHNRKAYSHTLETMDAYNSAERIMHSAFIAQEMARKNKDYSAFWRIEKELFEKLADYGFIPEVPKKVEFINGSPRTKEEFIELILSSITRNDSNVNEVRERDELKTLPR